jgi:hypothetical protein
VLDRLQAFMYHRNRLEIFLAETRSSPSPPLTSCTGTPGVDASSRPQLLGLARRTAHNFPNFLTRDAGTHVISTTRADIDVNDRPNCAGSSEAAHRTNSSLREADQPGRKSADRSRCRRVMQSARFATKREKRRPHTCTGTRWHSSLCRRPCPCPMDPKTASSRLSGMDNPDQVG